LPISLLLAHSWLFSKRGQVAHHWLIAGLLFLSCVVLFKTQAISAQSWLSFILFLALWYCLKRRPTSTHILLSFQPKVDSLFWPINGTPLYCFAILKKKNLSNKKIKSFDSLKALEVFIHSFLLFFLQPSTSYIAHQSSATHYCHFLFSIRILLRSFFPHFLPIILYFFKFCRRYVWIQLFTLPCCIKNIAYSPTQAITRTNIFIL
jgi:hypothetical protein